MDIAGSVVGVLSLGIQVCQGLLTYYDGWKDYNTDIATTYQSIERLKAMLVSLQALLSDLDENKRKNVVDAAHAAGDKLAKLKRRLEKLQTYGHPQGLHQNLAAQWQRVWYPFRQSTLMKLREIVSDTQDQLRLSLHILELDVRLESGNVLKEVHTQVRGTALEMNKLSLQNEQTVELLQSSTIHTAVWWVHAPDPGTNFISALKRREPGTGQWLLDSDVYQNWKTGHDPRLLWLYGKAGCGKSVISATAIEDIKNYCMLPNFGFGMFFYTFSDTAKQSWQDCLRSLVVQLATKEPAVSMLINEYQSSRSPPSLSVLEKIFLTELQSFDQVFFIIDALDESPDTTDGHETIRGQLLEELKQLASHPQVKILVTSRDLNDIRKEIEPLGTALSMNTDRVNQDIRKYISSQLTKDKKLSKLNEQTKEKIMSALMNKADGMFRWAYCQLQELKNMKSAKPSFIDRILRSLPETLDETYERMLDGIDKSLQNEALIMLRWLAYARRPLSLKEIIETTVIDIEQGVVQIDDRGDVEDVLDILASLVMVIEGEDVISNDDQDGSDDGQDDPEARQSISPDTVIRLAHFSVKEYLESERISSNSTGRYFQLLEGKEHAILTNSCLTYMTNFVKSSIEESVEAVDLVETYPLLSYMAMYWPEHSQKREDGNVEREVLFLQSRSCVDGWLSIGNHPSCEGFGSFDYGEFIDEDSTGFALYFAGLANLINVAKELLRLGTDIDLVGGAYGSALQGVSGKNGLQSMLRLLLEHGADVNSSGDGGTALILAAQAAQEDNIQTLIEFGADVNVAGPNGTALTLASEGCSASTIQLLIDHGVDINEPNSDGESAIHVASTWDNVGVVELLIAHGVDVNIRGSNGTPLEIAMDRSCNRVVRILLENGATAISPA